jgi:MFS-type transporter involved in bile tolerance (Atg22 family)
MRNFGAIYGILTLISIIGSGIGPVWAATVYDSEKSYASVLYIFAALMALSGVIAFFVTSMARKNAGVIQGQTADVVK